MKTIITILIMCFLPMFCGCKKVEISEEYNLLVGSWEFIGESYYYNLEEEPTQYNHILEFKQKGKYKVNFEVFGKNTEYGRIENISKPGSYLVELNHDSGFEYYNGKYVISIFENYLDMSSYEKNLIRTYRKI